MNKNTLALNMLSEHIHLQHKMINIAIIQQQNSEQGKKEKILKTLFSKSFDNLLIKQKTYLTEVSLTMDVYLIIKKKKIKYFSTLTPNIFKLLFLNYRYIPFKIKFQSELDQTNITFIIEKNSLNIFKLIFRSREKIRNETILQLDNSQIEVILRITSTPNE